MYLTTQIGTSGPNGTILRAMFEARRRIFVDMLKWDVPVLAGRYEIDQFDDEHAEYLVLTDAAGAHLGSARLLDTERPHILDTLFPALCEGAIPRGSDVREITRFAVDPRPNARERRIVRNALVHALAAHALHSGIRRYTGVAEPGWLQQILAFGWDCAPLGLPRQVGDAFVAALEIAITPETPALLEANGLGAAATLSLPIRHAA